MKRFSWFELAVLACMLLLFTLASGSESRAETTRIATLLPFVADALEGSPEGTRIVANVRRDLHTPLTADTIDLGNPHSPNFEKLVEARPDLVIGDRQLHSAIASKVESLGAELVLIDTSSVASTLAALSSLANRLGPSRTIDSRIEGIREKLAQLRIDEPVRILPLFGAPGSFYAVTERAWLGALATEVGFENIAPTDHNERLPGFVVLNDEIVSTLQPELVVIVAHGDPRKVRGDLERRVAQGGAWSSLGRARLGIHVLDPRLFSSNPGLEIDRAAHELVALATSRQTTPPAPEVSTAAPGTDAR